jgi:hypothetical protein
MKYSDFVSKLNESTINYVMKEDVAYLGLLEDLPTPKFINEITELASATIE